MCNVKPSSLMPTLLALILLGGVIACGETGESSPGAAESLTDQEEVEPGSTKIELDPKSGKLVTKHFDESGVWHTVDFLEVTREIWGIPPEVKVEDFDFDSADQPDETSPEEMNTIMKRHYLD